MFDASALLAIMLGETGADIAEQHLPGAVLSVVNYSEVLGKLLQRGMPEAPAKAGIEKLISDIVSFGKGHAELTAAFLPRTTALGLSFGDRACLALGTILAMPVVTAERRWTEFDGKVEVVLIR